jgi:hypothetical protein
MNLEPELFSEECKKCPELLRFFCHLLEEPCEECQRWILGEMYNDYSAFCKSRGAEPMDLLDFINHEIKYREEAVPGGL